MLKLLCQFHHRSGAPVVRRNLDDLIFGKTTLARSRTGDHKQQHESKSKHLHSLLFTKPGIINNFLAILATVVEPQLVERSLPIHEFQGSNPVIGLLSNLLKKTKIKKRGWEWLIFRFKIQILAKHGYVMQTYCCLIGLINSRD